MKTLLDLWAAARAERVARREARRRRARLRREILGYRTPAERDELQAILGRYDMSVDDLLAGRRPPPLSDASSPQRWDAEWTSIVLDLSPAGDEPGQEEPGSGCPEPGGAGPSGAR